MYSCFIKLKAYSGLVNDQIMYMYFFENNTFDLFLNLLYKTIYITTMFHLLMCVSIYIFLLGFFVVFLLYIYIYLFFYYYKLFYLFWGGGYYYFLLFFFICYKKKNIFMFFYILIMRMCHKSETKIMVILITEVWHIIWHLAACDWENIFTPKKNTNNFFFYNGVISALTLKKVPKFKYIYCQEGWFKNYYGLIKTSYMLQ